MRWRASKFVHTFERNGGRQALVRRICCRLFSMDSARMSPASSCGGGDLEHRESCLLRRPLWFLPCGEGVHLGWTRNEDPIEMVPSCGSGSEIFTHQMTRVPRWALHAEQNCCFRSPSSRPSLENSCQKESTRSSVVQAREFQECNRSWTGRQTSKSNLEDDIAWRDNGSSRSKLMFGSTSFLLRWQGLVTSVDTIAVGRAGPEIIKIMVNGCIFHLCFTSPIMSTFLWEQWVGKMLETQLL